MPVPLSISLFSYSPFFLPCCRHKLGPSTISFSPFLFLSFSYPVIRHNQSRLVHLRTPCTILSPSFYSFLFLFLSPGRILLLLSTPPSDINTMSVSLGCSAVLLAFGPAVHMQLYFNLLGKPCSVEYFSSFLLPCGPNVPAPGTCTL